MRIKMREFIFRVWYWYISFLDKRGEVTFMNYGYHDPAEKIDLDDVDEINRYSIQLYHHLASSIDLKGKKLVEVGCGRGGGLAYVAKTFRPGRTLGIDLNKRAVEFSNKHYKMEGLNFENGDAQGLDIEENTFDVVLNVESSHRYPEVNKFFEEVNRVLKPGGYFLYTDFRKREEIGQLNNHLDKLGFTQIGYKKINEQVAHALKVDSHRRKHLVKKLAPRFLHKTAFNFAGIEGSDTYHKIVNGDFEYFLYVFQKY